MAGCVFAEPANTNGSLPSAQPSRMMRIDSVKVVKEPLVRNDSVFYALDCFFTGVLGSFWYSYDSLERAVVIEFFETGIPEYETKLPPDFPFRRLTANIASTKLALTNSEARVAVTVDKGPEENVQWNCSVDTIGNRALRIVIGKKIEGYHSAVYKKPSRLPVIIAAISLSCLLIAAGIVFLIDIGHS